MCKALDSIPSTKEQKHPNKQTNKQIKVKQQIVEAVQCKEKEFFGQNTCISILNLYLFTNFEQFPCSLNVNFLICKMKVINSTFFHKVIVMV
jgi:hypothetical protein